MKKLLMATCIATALAACSNGDGSDKSKSEDSAPPVAENPTGELSEEQKEAIEEAFNLPPEPDADENNATVLGIDSNDNNIRDDIERHIAFEHHDEPVVLNILSDIAKDTNEEFELLVNDEGETTQEEYLQATANYSVLISCLSQYYGSLRAASPVIDELSKRTVNTIERYKAENQISAKLSGSIISSPSDEEITEACAKYFEAE